MHGARRFAKGCLPALATPLLVLATGLLAACNQGLGRTSPPVSCTPECFDRECGEDGCHGFCGECTDGRSCNVLAGRCVGGDEGLVTGRLEFEYRTAVIDGGGARLAGLETLAARNAWAVVADGDGSVLGAREILGEDGSFAVPTSRPLTGDERLLFTALWAPPPDSEVLLAVLHRTANYDSEASLPVWAWTRTVPASGDAGTITITEDDGSGAMFLYLINRRAQDSVLSAILGGAAGSLVRLAILWAPGASGMCGACYARDIAPRVDEGGVTIQLRQSIFIDDEPGGSGAWGFPVLLHEFGHYVAHNYSRDDSPGGPHWIGGKVVPPFAWSEGWASFFGAMTATQWFGTPRPVYWDIQGGDSFWIDYGDGDISGNRSIQFPAPAAGDMQDLDESFVTLALWHLWDERDGGESDGTGLTADAILKAVSSPRFLQKDRGYPAKSDLVDFLDAAACDDPERTGLLQDRMNDELRFPWDGKPLCLGGVASRVPSARPMWCSGPGTQVEACGLRSNLSPEPESPRARPTKPLAPLSVDLQVREQGTGLVVTARPVFRGRVPGDVRLSVRWRDRNAVGGESRVEAVAGPDGTDPGIRVTLPRDAMPIRAVATSTGRGLGARGEASWPPDPTPPAAAPRWIPLPPVAVPGGVVDTAVSLDRE